MYKREMKKSVVGVLVLLLSLLMSTIVCFASYLNEENGNRAVIVDEAGLLTDSEEQALYDGVMGALTQVTNVFFVLIDKNQYGYDADSTQYDDIYIQELYNSRFPEQDEEVNCIVVLVDMENYWVQMKAYGQMEELTNDDSFDVFSDDVMQAAGDGRYYTFGRMVFDLVYKREVGETKDDSYLMEVVDPETGYRGFLQDESALLKEEEKRALLEQKVKPLLAYTNVIVASTDHNPYGFSTSSTEYEKQYCSHLYDSFWGRTDDGDYENAIIFLVDMHTRWIYIYREGRIRQEVTDNVCDIITDNIYTYATDKNYRRCYEKGLEELLSIMEGKSIEQPMKVICNVLLSLCIGFILTYWYASQTSKARKTGNREMLEGTLQEFAAGPRSVRHTYTDKVYHPPSSSGGGRSGGGGGSHGGGGGHRF